MRCVATGLAGLRLQLTVRQSKDANLALISQLTTGDSTGATFTLASADTIALSPGPYFYEVWVSTPGARAPAVTTGQFLLQDGPGVFVADGTGVTPRDMLGSLFVEEFDSTQEATPHCWTGYNGAQMVRGAVPWVVAADSAFGGDRTVQFSQPAHNSGSAIMSGLGSNPYWAGALTVTPEGGGAQLPLSFGYSVGVDALNLFMASDRKFFSNFAGFIVDTWPTAQDSLAHWLEAWTDGTSVFFVIDGLPFTAACAGGTVYDRFVLSRTIEEPPSQFATGTHRYHVFATAKPSDTIRGQMRAYAQAHFHCP